jgi:hypothetical protein
VPEQLIKDLTRTLQDQHQFLRDHAKTEETVLNTIDKTLGELAHEMRANTQSSMRAADVAEARLAMEEKREERRAAAEEAERQRAAELEKVELEQRGKVGAFLQAQWEKYGMIVMGVLVISFAPQLAPVLLQYLGLATPQQVEVVHHSPVEQPAPAPDPEESVP